MAADYTDTFGLWVFDLDRGTKTLIAANPGGIVPRWTPDGAEIVYATTNGNNIAVKASDGTDEERLILERARSQYPVSWTPDGSVLAITDNTDTGNLDIWLVERDGDARVFLATDANENAAAFSPDGAWIAYQSDESGRPEIYLQRFPEPGVRVLVSNNGGRAPVWRRDGGELFYRQGTALMSVPIDWGETPRVEKPVLLFDGPYQADNTGHPSYDVSPDGERFLMVRQSGVVPTELKVILNLEAELERQAAQN